MPRQLDDLCKWYNDKDARKPALSRITLGQLFTLLRLQGEESVASLALGNKSEGVNYRQMLARLEGGLGIGKITQLSGSRSQLTKQGKRVANEFRLLLEGIRNLDKESQPRLLHIAAGDTWVQSVIIPSVWSVRAELEKNGQKRKIGNQYRWKVSNLETWQIIDGIRNGEIHFGLLRSKDCPKDEPCIRPVCTWKIPSLALLVGAEAGQLKGWTDQSLIKGLLERNVPWIQHAGSWPAFADFCRTTLGVNLVSEPEIQCGTHFQSAISIVGREAWTLVPSQIANVLDSVLSEVSGTTERYHRYDLKQPPMQDSLQMVCNPRIVEGFKGLETLKHSLKKQFTKHISPQEIGTASR